MTARSLGRRTLNAITHHSQPQSGQSTKSVRCHQLSLSYSYLYTATIQIYPEKSFPRSCNGHMVSLLGQNIGAQAAWTNKVRVYELWQRIDTAEYSMTTNSQRSSCQIASLHNMFLSPWPPIRTASVSLTMHSAWPQRADGTCSAPDIQTERYILHCISMP